MKKFICLGVLMVLTPIAAMAATDEGWKIIEKQKDRPLPFICFEKEPSGFAKSYKTAFYQKDVGSVGKACSAGMAFIKFRSKTILVGRLEKYADLFANSNAYEVLNEKRPAYLEEEHQAYLNDYQNAKTMASILAFEKIYANDDPDKLIDKLQPVYEKLWRDAYVEDFKDASTSEEWRAFIEKYSQEDQEDQDNLIPKAEERLAKIEEDARIKKEKAENDARLKKEREEAEAKAKKEQAENIMTLKIGRKAADEENGKATEPSAKQTMSPAQYKKYRGDFENAKTYRQLADFISNNYKNDPDKLVPEAWGKQKIIKENEKREKEKESVRAQKESEASLIKINEMYDAALKGKTYFAYVRGYNESRRSGGYALLSHQPCVSKSLAQEGAHHGLDIYDIESPNPYLRSKMVLCWFEDDEDAAFIRLCVMYPDEKKGTWDFYMDCPRARKSQYLDIESLPKSADFSK